MSILENNLRQSIPIYGQTFFKGLFIYDLTDPTNNFAPDYFAQKNRCIEFVDNHIYHFAPVEYEESLSHIAILEKGKLKIFKLINCRDDALSEAIEYARQISPEETLTRLKNYRRYGFYRTIDSYRVSCNFDKTIPQNSAPLYNRGSVLEQLADALRGSVSVKAQSHFPPFSVEESRANGFFVWDLTEPANKQTSLLERVEFKNFHIYHFAYIDAPFSFSNIAVLEDGKLKIFKNINCSGKGDSLKDVIGYLNQKLETNRNKKEILKRVKNYRKFGVYASYNGLSKPQCKEAIGIEN